MGENMKERPQTFQVLSFNPKTTMLRIGRGFVREYPILFALVLPLFCISPARAASLAFISYADASGDGIAQSELYNFFGDNGGQLTDGAYGVNDFPANPDNVKASQWVDWRVADPVITFHFSKPVTINQVGIDFSRTESDLIFHPFTGLVDGADFAVNPNAIRDDTRGTLLFDGSWTGTTLTVDLLDCNRNDCRFINEITCHGVTSVPEPSVFGLLAWSLGLLILHLKQLNFLSSLKFPGKFFIFHN
jgi:hypothetical protein